MPPWLTITLTAAAAWIALIALSRWLHAVPFRRSDYEAAILVRTIQLHARLFHRLTVDGAENIPLRGRAVRATGAGAPERAGACPGPLVIVANHTAGVDPLLIQAALDFEPRWMMAEDMRDPRLESLWRYANIIFVDRAQRDTRSLREALRHLRAGGVVGVFPEGFIERPPRHLLPFRPGVGLLIRKAGAPALPVIIEGTPQAPTAMGSLFRTSHARIRFLPIVRFEGADLTPGRIAADLHRRFADATGWPSAPRAPIVTPTRQIMLDLDGNYIDERGNPVPDSEARAIAEHATLSPTPP